MRSLPDILERAPTETLAGVDADGAENSPLTFELKLTKPPALSEWLESRGIGKETAARWALGQASAKSKTIANRLAIPIRDEKGRLVAYCGRYIGDDVPEDVPKYVLPKGFQKELEVFNLDRTPPNPSNGAVVIVESYLSVIRHDHAMPIVSMMGRSISPQQTEKLATAGFRQAVVVSDGDQPGRDGARSIAGDLAASMWTRVLDLPDGVKPHQMETDALYQLLKEHW